MKRLFIIIIVLTGLSGGNNAVYAQVGLGASAGINLPVGMLGDRYNASLGIQTSFRYQAMDELAVGLNAGYHRFAMGNTFNRGSESFVPVTGFLEYFISDESIRPYLGIDAGVYLYMVSSWISGINQYDMRTDPKFGIAPVAGLMFETVDRLMINGNVKYHYVVNSPQAGAVSSRPFSWFGLNVGVVYMLSE